MKSTSDILKYRRAIKRFEKAREVLVEIDNSTDDRRPTQPLTILQVNDEAIAKINDGLKVLNQRLQMACREVMTPA